MFEIHTATNNIKLVKGGMMHFHSDGKKKKSIFLHMLQTWRQLAAMLWTQVGDTSHHADLQVKGHYRGHHLLFVFLFSCFAARLTKLIVAH